MVQVDQTITFRGAESIILVEDLFFFTFNKIPQKKTVLSTPEFQSSLNCISTITHSKMYYNENQIANDNAIGENKCA